jgi:hypothetical protein
MRLLLVSFGGHDWVDDRVPAVLAILGSTSGTQLKEEELRKMGKYVGDQKLLASAEDLKSTGGAVESGGSGGSESESGSDGGAKRVRKQEALRVPGKTAIAGVLIWKFAHRELDGLGYSFSTKPKI